MSGNKPTPRRSSGAMVNQGRTSRVLGANDPRLHRSAAARTTDFITGAFVSLDEQGRVTLDYPALLTRLQSDIQTSVAQVNVAELAGSYLVVDASGALSLDYDAVLAQVANSIQGNAAVQTAGDDFPANPFNGRQFYNTALGEAFAYNAATGEWWSLRTHVAAFTNGVAIGAGVNLRTFQSSVGTSTEGILLGWDAVLVEAYAWQVSAVAAAQFDVRGGATVRVSFGMAVADRSRVYTGGTTQFFVGDVVNVQAGVALASGGGIEVVFRRRAT